jgi:hypothetical protein
MANYGWVDCTVQCPTHAGFTSTERVFGTNGQVIRRVIYDTTNADYFVAYITITLTAAAVEYAITIP